METYISTVSDSGLFTLIFNALIGNQSIASKSIQDQHWELYKITKAKLKF